MTQLAEKIQDSELEVMRALWAAGGAAPLNEIRSGLAQKRGWEDSTVKTLLRRLCQKGAVEQEGRGRYRAVVTEADYRRQTARKCVSKAFAGSAKALVAALLDDGQLSPEDVSELRALLDEEARHD